MKRNWGKRIAWVALATLAVLAVIGVILFIWNPEAAILLVAVILQPLLANTHPPAIADGNVATEELTRVLEQKFPAGTNEAALRATLFSQGFRPPTPPPVKCWPRGQPAPVGQVIFPCPLHDPSKTLEYRWSSLVCGDTITVWWTTEDNGKITRIGGDHVHACL